jgi:glycerophosphoryl diester phosphodiesterase
MHKILRILIFFLILFFFSCKAVTEKQELKPLIIGHRGLPSHYPENTKESFDGLLSNGITHVETDLLMAANDSVMIFEDIEVSRFSTLTGLLINTNSDSLKKAMKKKTGGTGLTLNEFIILYHNKFTTIFLEIKQGQGSINIIKVMEQIIKIIKHNKNLIKNVVVISSDFYNLQYIRSHDFGGGIKLGINNYGRSSLDIAIRERFNYALVEFRNADHELYDNAKLANKKLILYTAKNVVEIEKALTAGCDGVITSVALDMKRYYQTQD